MTSYLAEVLSSVERVEVEQINTKCPEVATAVETCKTEVLTFLENVYVRFSERPRQNKTLANKVNQLQEDMTGLMNSVEHITRKEISNAESEFEKQLDRLSKVNIALNLVATVYNIHEALVKIRELRQDQKYFDCMKTIKETEDFVNNLRLDDNLPVIEELSLHLSAEKNSLLNCLSNIFGDNVILKHTQNESVIKILNENDQLKEVLSALYFYGTSVTHLDHVTKFLWSHVFIPVVDYITEIKISTENDFAVLEIAIVDSKKKSSYAEVFDNIKKILSYLLNNFDIDLCEDLSTMSYIGRDVRDNLSELIIKHCLQDTIPSTNEGLQQYKVVIEATEDLEKNLVLSKIFASDTTSILEYANNIDILFINKKCQEYVLQAQDLMKQDLHVMVEIGQEETSSSLDTSVEFPRCSISRSVIELLNLLEKILVQATNSSEVCAGRLFCTVRNICQKYTIFVPEHHKKLLLTIPQQIALFYNNCMFISHKLFEWNDTHLKKMPSLLNINLNSFNDEGRQLREIASEKFSSYVNSQIKQIEEIMKESDLNFQKQTLEVLDPQTEKCLRQCLRQQELLKTVWHKVLPYSVYNKTLGTILNSLCCYLINSIICLEDISSDSAEQLVKLFKMVQTRGPNLFTDPKEVTLFVSSWYKLNETAFVLNASLLDINDRWTDGKGPLALQFKSEELRQLVRALFQNTERRAALLAKIYD